MMTRRDILKGLFSLPIFGLFFQQFYSKRNSYDQKRAQILKELNLDTQPQVAEAALGMGKKSDLIRIGIIGFGNRGQSLAGSLGYLHPRRIEYLKKQYENNTKDTRYQDWLVQEDLNIELTAVCDVFGARRVKSEELIGNRSLRGGEKNTNPKIKSYRDYRDLLANSEIDAVVIATPDFHHAQMTIEAVNTGKHVYCEKCMTRTEDEVSQVVTAVKKSEKVFQLGHQYTQNSSYHKAKEIIDKNILGKINLIEMTSNRNTPDGAWVRHLTKDGKPRPGNEQTIDWDLWLGSRPKVPFSIDRYYNWTKWWDYATGLAGQLMCHEYDTANQFLDLGIPKSVVASGGIYFHKDGRDIPDVFQAVFEFPDRGLTFIYSASLASSRDRGRVFMGHDGSMEVGNNVSVMIDRNSTQFRERIDQGIIDTSAPVLSYQQGAKDIDAITSATEKYYASRGLTWTYQNGRRVDTAYLHLEEWLDCIRFGGTPSCDIKKGFEVTMACHMATRSYREKRRVEWDPVAQKIV
jgi:predicted dehydrogenase